MSFPRYPAYKPSGVEWLGEVPEHWDVKRVRRIFEIKKRIAGELGFDILSITQQGIKVRDPESNDGQVSMDYSKYQVVEPGDFAMNHMDLLTGYVDISRRLGVTSPDYRVFSIAEPSRSDPGYLLYIFQMGYRQKILYAYGQGSSQLGRWRLPTEEFQDWTIPFPSLEEQASIATFLDHETAKIDALIAEQQRLIELLQEKRQAVISHAVTKGLNPDAPMKDSGVEWLGEVPEHWEILKISKITHKITNGYVGPTRDILVEDGIPYIQATHIKRGRINFDSNYYVRAEWSAAHAKSVLMEGDVLIVQTGAGTGDAGLVSLEDEGFNCHALIILAPTKAMISGRFLLAVLLSSYGKQKLESIQTGGMHPHLNCGNVKFVDVPVPPISEQQAIVDFVASQTDSFEILSSDTRVLIGLLQERRSALISAAVTGQIDVRGLVPEDEAA